MTVRLAVDPIACDGRGLCAELLPGLITLDDWGFPMVSSRDVPGGLRGEAMAAVRMCPRLALRLESSGDRRDKRLARLGDHRNRQMPGKGASPSGEGNPNS